MTPAEIDGLTLSEISLILEAGQKHDTKRLPPGARPVTPGQVIPSVLRRRTMTPHEKVQEAMRRRER